MQSTLHIINNRYRLIEQIGHGSMGTVYRINKVSHIPVVVSYHVHQEGL